MFLACFLLISKLYEIIMFLQLKVYEMIMLFLTLNLTIMQTIHNSNLAPDQSQPFPETIHTNNFMAKHYGHIFPIVYHHKNEEPFNHYLISLVQKYGPLKKGLLYNSKIFSNLSVFTGFQC